MAAGMAAAAEEATGASATGRDLRTREGLPAAAAEERRPAAARCRSRRASERSVAGVIRHRRAAERPVTGVIRHGPAAAVAVPGVRGSRCVVPVAGVAPPAVSVPGEVRRTVRAEDWPRPDSPDPGRGEPRPAAVRGSVDVRVRRAVAVGGYARIRVGVRHPDPAVLLRVDPLPGRNGRLRLRLLVLILRLRRGLPLILGWGRELGRGLARNLFG